MHGFWTSWCTQLLLVAQLLGWPNRPCTCMAALQRVPPCLSVILPSLSTDSPVALCGMLQSRAFHFSFNSLRCPSRLPVMQLSSPHSCLSSSGRGRLFLTAFLNAKHAQRVCLHCFGKFHASLLARHHHSSVAFLISCAGRRLREGHLQLLSCPQSPWL